MGPCQNIVLIYKPDDARVSEEGRALRPQIHSPVPSGRSTCASRSFCAARAAAQPCSICSLTAAHRPLGTRGCTLGARRCRPVRAGVQAGASGGAGRCEGGACRPVRAGVQAGASGVAGGSSVCSPISELDLHRPLGAHARRCVRPRHLSDPWRRHRRLGQVAPTVPPLLRHLHHCSSPFYRMAGRAALGRPLERWGAAWATS